jgi:hypothetical protein
VIPFQRPANRKKKTKSVDGQRKGFPWLKADRNSKNNRLKMCEAYSSNSDVLKYNVVEYCGKTDPTKWKNWPMTLLSKRTSRNVTTDINMGRKHEGTKTVMKYQHGGRPAEKSSPEPLQMHSGLLEWSK